jgi:hypothetical protein
LGRGVCVSFQSNLARNSNQHPLGSVAAQAECDCPKLLKFRGRPREYSPKVRPRFPACLATSYCLSLLLLTFFARHQARFLNFLGFKLPFDRHDWVVDRCGTDVRYIIDFYNGACAFFCFSASHPLSLFHIAPLVSPVLTFGFFFHLEMQPSRVTRASPSRCT